MDFWETLVANSSLAEVDGDVWEHLTNPSAGNDSPRFIPYDDLVLDIQIDRMTVDMQNNILEIDVQTKDIDIEFYTTEFSVDIENTELEIDSTC